MSSPDDPTLVFIKDYWYADGTRPERDTYTLLQQHGVRNIASVLAGGDVGGQRAQMTDNQSFFPEDRCPSKRIHHRIVTNRIGRRLETYEEQRELLRCVYDALLGTQPYA